MERQIKEDAASTIHARMLLYLRQDAESNDAEKLGDIVITSGFDAVLRQRCSCKDLSLHENWKRNRKIYSGVVPRLP